MIFIIINYYLLCIIGISISILILTILLRAKSSNGNYNSFASISKTQSKSKVKNATVREKVYIKEPKATQKDNYIKKFDWKEVENYMKQ